MADFMRMMYENPKLKQSQIATHLGYSTSTLQRYKNDANKLSPYRIHPNNANKRTKKASNTNFNNDSHGEPDVKRPQMTSIDPTQTNTKPNRKNKNILEAGVIQKNTENNDQYLDEILDNNVI